MTDFVIRRGRREDVGYCVDLGKSFHATSYWRGRDYVPEKVAAFAENALQNPYKLYLVSENENGVYGFFVARWSEMFYNYERVSDEEVLWVQKGSGTLWTMMGFFKEWENWAKANGCSLLHYNPTSHAQYADKWNKFMKRYGYEQAGASYRKEL